MIELVLWKLPSWEDFRKHILNTCALVDLLKDLKVHLPTRLITFEIQRQGVLIAGVM